MPHDKGHVYSRFQLVKLGVKLQHVELQYHLVLLKTQRKVVNQRFPAHLSSRKGLDRLCCHSVGIAGRDCSLPQVANLELLVSDHLILASTQPQGATNASSSGRFGL